MPPDLTMLGDPNAAMQQPMARDYIDLGQQGQSASDTDQQDDPRALHQQLLDNIQSSNLAADMDDDELSAIGQKVIREYDIDLTSRGEWEDRSRKAMDLAMQVAKAKTNPWPGASNIVYPLMTSAAVQFAARAYPAIVQGRNVAKGVIVGKDDGTPVPPEMLQQLQAMMSLRLGMGGGPAGMLPGPGAMPGMGMGAPPGMQMPPQGGPPPPMGGPMPPQQMGGMGGPPGAPQQPIWLVPPGAKAERAQRVGDHMSWQLLEEMKSWEEDTDKLLHILPIVGCCFRKSYYDSGVRHNASDLVLAENLVIDYHAKSMERAPRVTERIWFYPYEIQEQIRSGLFCDHDYKTEDANGDDDAPVEFLEQHRWLDLDDDDYPEPYIVTVHKKSGKVARIVARYDAEGVDIDEQTGAVRQIDPVHYYTKYDFLPNPDGGIYGVGFGQLLGPINEAVNTTLNMLFDAGNLQNSGGGFLARGVSMHVGSLKFRLGEWKQINVPGSALKDAIVPFAHPGPSGQLIQLLTFLIDAGREVASVKDVLSGETAAATMQPTTLMALIEQGLKVFTAIFKRVHRALKSELNKLYRLNRIYLQHQAQYQIGDEWRTVTKDDYMRGAGVTPVSDPNMVSDMQRMAQAQLLQSYQNDPFCNPIETRKRVFGAAQIEKPEQIIVEQMPPNPQILAQTAELEARHREIDIKAEAAKASQIRDITQAILNIANAEKATAAIDQADASIKLDHSAQWIKLLEMQFDALTAPAANRGQPQGPGGMPPAPPSMPQMPPRSPAFPTSPSESPMLQ